MADLKISALNSLAGADLVAADVVAVVDDSASETKKLTVSDLIANGTTLISDATIPSAKILFSAGSIDTAELAASAVETAKINDSAVTAAKLADNSSVTLVSSLPASGDFTGQVALDTTNDKIYVWDGSSWDSVKAAGSINVVNGSTTGEINIVTSTSGDTVTVSATLDDTTAAAQFLAGPTGAGGTVGYRAIIGTDLPAATTTTKGAVIVNGEGLRMDSNTIEIDNDLTANTTTFQAVKFDSKGLITSGRDITSADLPDATNGATGAVKPGTGLEMGTGGAIDHSNSVTGATKTKITFDAQGHVTAGTDLAASDIPDLDTAKITTGTFPTARIADDAVTAAKLGDRSTATIAETTPAGGAFIGQTHLNSITGDYFLWDGNVWQPIGISVGEIVLAGTYDASTNLMATVTSEGTALSYVVGSALPAASASNKGYYVVVSEAGTGTSPAPTVALNPPDFLLSTGTAYTEIDVSSTVTAQQASNVAFTAAGNIAATNVQSAIEELDTEKVGAASPAFTGTVALGEDAVITFEGATSNDFETTLTVVDPTADRTVSLPNVTGTLISSGDTGTVTSTMILDGTIANADISSSAEIAVSKLANGTARQLLQTDSAGTGVEFTSNVDVPGTFDCTGAGTFDSTLTVTGLISADGKVSFPAGTASAPSFYFGTDTNTGLYHSAADEVAITTGGTQRVVVDSSGNVGIGVSSASEKLHIAGNLRIDSGSSGKIDVGDVTSNYGRIYADSTGTFVGSVTSNPLILRTVNSERLRIDTSGNVGIGTTSPDQRLEVSSSSLGTAVKISTSANQSAVGDVHGEIVFEGKNSSGTVYETAEIKSVCESSAGTRMAGLAFTTSGSAPGVLSEKLRITHGGNVGIGTTSPNAATGDKALHIHSSASSGTRGACLHLTTNSSGTATSDGAEINLIDNDLKVFNKESGIIYFGTANTERMRIDSSGVLTVRSSSSTDKFILGGNINASDGTSIRSMDSGATNYKAFEILSAETRIGGTNSVRFSTSGTGGSTERMRIDSSGHVAVGDTATQSFRFKVKNSAGEIARFTDGVSQTLDIRTVTGGVQLRQSNNGFISFNALVGASTVEHARVDSSGRFLVGKTSTTHNHLLQIKTSTNTDAIAIAGRSSDDVSEITFYENDDTTILGQIQHHQDHAIYRHRVGYLRFDTGGLNERMRIASNGVVTVKNGAVAEIDTLTSASTVTPDFAASCNFTLTLGTNVTLANPSNLTAGQSGSIFLVQDGTGSRTITFGSYWDFAGGTAPTLSTAASSVDRLDYIVRSSTSIHAVVTLAYS